VRSYRYFHLDVFTGRAFGGNQLAVFLDGRGLSAGQMQTIAREMNFSESTFVLPPEQPGTDVRMRIFTPFAELPAAGHPTVGSTFALARAGVIDAGRERFVFGLGVGPTPVTLTWRGGELTFVWMSQLTPAFIEHQIDPADMAGALGLQAAAVSGTGLPIETGSSGAPFLFVPLATRRAVDGAWLDQRAFEQVRTAHGLDAHGVFVFSPERGTDTATVNSRMFAPGLGVVEDPATGIASGPLGAYLVRHKVVAPQDAGGILSLQGAAMGRPSFVHIAVGVENGEVTSVRVGGESVVVGEGTIYI
jgi:trans-2,3-dihydro-3-hydroxyanthranilate isomerase